MAQRQPRRYQRHEERKRALSVKFPMRVLRAILDHAQRRNVSAAVIVIEAVMAHLGLVEIDEQEAA